MVRTTANAEGVFTVSLVTGQAGSPVTATEHDAAGNTSKFSPARSVVTPEHVEHTLF